MTVGISLNDVISARRKDGNMAVGMCLLTKTAKRIMHSSITFHSAISACKSMAISAERTLGGASYDRYCCHEHGNRDLRMLPSLTPAVAHLRHVEISRVNSSGIMTTSCTLELAAHWTPVFTDIPCELLPPLAIMYTDIPDGLGALADGVYWMVPRDFTGNDHLPEGRVTLTCQLTWFAIKYDAVV